MMPNDGRINTYTSGCPKIQNRCCHRSGSAPAATSKNCAPNTRWKLSKKRATVITGIAKSSRNCTTVIIHVKIGIFMSVMPGARMLSTVTMRLMAPVSEAIPAIWRPSAQKSTPWLGENTGPEFGAYMNQPPSAAPPRNHDRLTTMPPPSTHQKPNALRRGNATSRAPICSGMK